ncbi:MAG: HDOD domain-containing protein [Gammaproteobacteria bacterium]|nr:HDOD domain-containing protein [Gammaproteobacteria bacterium]
MKPITANELVASIDQAVSLPEVCLRINEMVEDASSSAQDISQVIMQDANLSARLLRLVNSAYYGLPGKVSTISRAITFVGTEELRDLTIVTTSCKMFSGIPSSMINMRDFWHYSIATGILARQFSRQCNVLHPERLFVVGVLHDIGRLVILWHLSTLARDILLIAHGKNQLFSAAEQEVLGFTHSEVGYELCQNWKLPQSIANIIRFHHQPGSAKEHRLETALVHIAQALAYDLVWPSESDTSVDNIDEQTWELSGLSLTQCQETLGEAGLQIMELYSLLVGNAARHRTPA